MSITRKMKTVLTAVMAVAMVFCLSFGAFAATDSAANDPGNVTVTFQMQEVNREFDSTGALPVVTSMGPDVVVNNVAPTATLESLIEANFTPCGWTEVDILDPGTWLPTGEKGHALKSLTYNGTAWTKNVEDTTANHYRGSDWAFFFGRTTPATNWTYPTTYLSHTTVADAAAQNYVVTLSYELTDMTW